MLIVAFWLGFLILWLFYMFNYGAASTSHILWHKWGPWTEIEQGTITQGSRKTGNYLVQRRVCSICQKAQLNTENTDNLC